MELDDILAGLSLDEKVGLLTGRDFWATNGNASIGLRPIILSDGPSGVRGPSWDERMPSLNLPSSSSLSSSWDVSLAAEYGRTLAREAVAKGVDVVLGPTINLHRSPLGGRHFEAFSEDPQLTADLAVAYIRGLQQLGIAATPKHFVANDSESERFTVDVIVDERTLRELYLRPFEAAVTEAGAWAIMSSYNSINGLTATENPLLETPLNSEWGFDGVVVSDWTAVRSLASASTSQDLAMPGPAGPWGDALIAAVRSGAVPEAVVDRKVLRLLRLAERVGAIEPGARPARILVEESDAGLTFARRVAVEGMVLLENRTVGTEPERPSGGAELPSVGAELPLAAAEPGAHPELPWSAADLGSIAVSGQNAGSARIQGGGSATVVPTSVVSPLDGIRAAFRSATVHYAMGALVDDGVVPFDPRTLRNPVSGVDGFRVRFLAASGSELLAEDREASTLVWFGDDAPLAEAATVELSAELLPSATTTLLLSASFGGIVRMFVDGVSIIDRDGAGRADLGAAFGISDTTTAAVQVEKGVARSLRFEFDVLALDPAENNALGISVGVQPPPVDGDALIAEAVDAAGRADVALVVVGTTAAVESEGWDRTTLALPGRQDELVAAVAAVNPHTVVIVNSGAPVLMPWRHDVAAILVGWFGGQQFGAALADVLTGAAEPGGRLPTTWPAEQADVPVIDVTPTDGRLVYGEGLHIGYRAWLRAGRTPAWPFGHGLGYTTWSFDGLRIEDPAAARVTVSNTGTRAGKQVVQLYGERPGSAIDRPVRWLIGFGIARAEPGETVEVDIALAKHAFAHWAVGADAGWRHEAGEFVVRAGASVLDLRLSATVDIR